MFKSKNKLLFLLAGILAGGLAVGFLPNGLQNVFAASEAGCFPSLGRTCTDVHMIGAEPRRTMGPSAFATIVRGSITGTASTVACAATTVSWTLTNGSLTEILNYTADGVTTATTANGAFLMPGASAIGNNGTAPSYSIISDGTAVSVSLLCVN